MAGNIKSSSELKNISKYELIQEEYINDLKSLGLVLKHKKSGARVVVLSNDDENKVFSIGFRTPPKDSTGVAHIVEHTVLCGSDKYPSKDPFVELAKGSLNTFLNAMTFSDKTIYPVASCNDKDYQNLMDVYLDAVFHPNIYKNKCIFQQEGWYYELEKPEDELKYNGVVYNEMKGVFSSPEQQLYRTIQASLFPDTAYGTESGGDPKNIPDLTYEEYLEFHKKYYHPSNSYIYLYGDLDIEEKLDWMDREYLSKYNLITVDSEIKLQKPFEETRQVKDYYSVSEGEEGKAGSYLSYNVVIDTSLNRELYLAFQILEYALISSPGAPLKQALIDGQIGTDILSQFENGIYQPYFSIIAKEVPEKKKESFLETIRETLCRISKEGIGEKALLAAINYHEFKFKEGDFGSYPKGLMYGIQILDSWLYNDHMPFIHINAESVFEEMKKNVKTGFFERLIERYLIENSHSSYVIIEPMIGKTAKEEQQIKEKLSAYKNTLSSDEINQIIKETKELRTWQETPSTQEELEKIPLLTREDIRKKVSPILNEKHDIAGVTILHHNIRTNGIAYLRIGFSLKDYIGYGKYFSLLSFILGKVNTKRYSFQEAANEINIHTGGIVFDVENYESSNREQFFPYFEITAKVLYPELKTAFELIEELLFQSRLDDKKRLKEIISETKSKMKIRINNNSHSLAAGRAMAYVSKSAQFNDSLVGMEFYQFLCSLEEMFEEKSDELVLNLKQLVNTVFTKENMILDITGEEEGFQAYLPCAETFVREIASKTLIFNGAGMMPIKPELTIMKPCSEGIKTAGQVQFAALAGNFKGSGLEYTGAFRVLRTIMSYEYLWVNIRVKGGAYGCMCNFMRNGNSYFVSYRDPNLKETFDVYKNAAEFVKEFAVNARDMTKYVLGTISMVDTPLNPAAKGNRSYNCYITGLSQEQLQKERDAIINAGEEDIRALAVHLEAILSNYVICVVGNENKIEESKDLFDYIYYL